MVSPVPPPLDLGPGLDALREGCFERAGISFQQLAQSRPLDPEGPFFEAFVLWWRLLEDPDNQDQIRLVMEERLTEAADRASRLSDRTDPALQEKGLVFSGVAQLLQSQSFASRGAHWKAAGAARRGHKALTRALKLNPDSADALFGLGAYDYYADKVSVLVKGLRVILFIPGGNDRRGIERLEQSARNSRLFGTESLMLLAHIFSGSFEEDYRRALSYAEEALGRYPSSPLIRLAYSDMLYETGRLTESMEQALEALSTISTKAGHPAELKRFAGQRLVECELGLKNPIGALERVESTLEDSLPDDPAGGERWISLLTEAAIYAGHPERILPWAGKLKASPAEIEKLKHSVIAARGDLVAARRAEALSVLAAGDLDRAETELRELQRLFPLDDRLRYDIGRLYQLEGRHTEALPHLEAASRSDRPEIAGWAFLRLGWEREESGDRKGASRLYSEALDIKRFRFHAAAKERLADRLSTPPEG